MLCRIYNKKGKIEKYNNVGVVDQKPAKFSEEVHYEEQENETKPEIKMYGQDGFRHNDQLYMDTSDSLPRLHTDSSCSEHVVSPDVTCDREVQSEPKWNELELGAEEALDFQFNFLDSDMNFSGDDPFAPQAQYQINQMLSPWQDMFMNLPKSF